MTLKLMQDKKVRHNKYFQWSTLSHWLCNTTNRRE